MLKFIFIVLVSLASGYLLGFQDAQVHTDNVFTRAVHQIGGANRGRVGVDADRQLDSLEKR